MTFIRVHSKTNLSPPLISFASLSSFPPGEAKAAAPQRVANLATPTGRVRFCNRSQILKRTG